MQRKQRKSRDLDRDYWLRVSDALLSGVDEDDLLQKICLHSMAAGCDWCVFDRWDNGEFYRAWILTSRPEDFEPARRLLELTRKPTGTRRIKTPTVYNSRSKTDRAVLLAGRKNSEALALVKRLGAKSAISVPLKGRSGFFGVVTAVREKAFDDLSLAGATELGRRMADVIENIRLRKALEHSEEKFRRVFDDNIIGLFVSNGSHIFEANDEYLRLSGLTREQVKRGASWEAITPPDLMGLCKEKVTVADRFGHCKPFEKRYLHPDGTEVPVLIGYSFMKTGRYVGYAIDLSALKKTERELQKAVQARDDFLSIASHELKTPLTSLMMQVHLLRHMGRSGGIDSLNEPKFLHKLDSVQRHIGRLGALVESLLDVSRVRNDRMALLPSRMELRALTKEVIDRFFDEAKQAGVSLVLSPGLPIDGIWDRLRVDQVLSNLISNAIKYGRGNPVQISLDSSRDRAMIRVRDQGIGIAENDHDRVFERFERAASHNYGGMGLGLYITHKIIEKHHGRIWVESRPGSGSTFFVDLPRERLGSLNEGMSAPQGERDADRI